MGVDFVDESFIAVESKIGQRYWAADHPVLEVLRSRRQQGGQGSPFPDGYRVGLAVEGGGMRGIVSGAMLCAIEELGFAPSLDAIYGFSAGALNAAYFFAGNCWCQLSIYYRDLATGAFIDFRRMVYGKSFLDLDYLFREIVDCRKPLSYSAIAESSVELHVGVTNVDALTTEDVSCFSSRADLVDTLRASSWMPISSFRTAIWRGARALDGAVLTGHPLRLAVNGGCTHVLSLSTRPIRPRSCRGPRSAQTLGALHLERIKKGLGAEYLSATNEYWLDRSKMHVERLKPDGLPYILDLAPLPWMPELRYRELDSGRLQDAARDAYLVAYAALSQSVDDSDRCADARAIPQLRFI